MNSLIYNIKKYCYCFLFHKKHLCYPDVSGKGAKGEWHCRKCHPCGDVFDLLLKKKVEESND